MMDFLGISLFFFIFLGIPIHYTISLLRDPVKVEWPSAKIDVERSKCESYIERRLYDALLFHGYDAQTQIPCGKYRIDITMPQEGLAIECDGKAFHSSKEQKAHDYRKNTYLRKNGWKVLRFSGRKINGNLRGVISKIEDEISKS